MTNEQAKREIDSLDFYLQNHTDDYGEESHTAMMMAIKALEQIEKIKSIINGPVCMQGYVPKYMDICEVLKEKE